MKVTHQIHMDVAETVCGDRDVQRQYLGMVVYFGPLAVQASSRQAVTSVDSPFPTYLEAMKRRVTRMPGWVALCRWSNTCRRRSLGMGGTLR
jgi:hypothetical protein